MIKAMRNTVVVKLHYKENVGKIILAECAKQYNAPFYGEVVSVGPDFKFKDELTKGDKLVFFRHEGKKIHWNNEEYLVLKEMHVMGKYED